MAGHIHIRETGIWNVTAWGETLIYKHASDPSQEVSEESDESDESNDPDESNEEITA